MLCLIWVHAVYSGMSVPIAAVFNFGAYCLLRPVSPYAAVFDLV